jgi:hypothetical protein
MGIIYADYYFLEALLRYERMVDNTAITPYRVFRNAQSQVVSPRIAPFDLLGRSIPVADADGMFIIINRGNFLRLR